jgi:hypothetical protein
MVRKWYCFSQRIVNDYSLLTLIGNQVYPHLFVWFDLFDEFEMGFDINFLVSERNDRQFELVKENRHKNLYNFHWQTI